jgi:kinesin family protein 2/24
MYKDLVKPLVPWAWSGGISTLFAYGQTGSGKTYSIRQLEELVAKDLMEGSLEGSRDVYVCVFELIGNNAFGNGPLPHQKIVNSHDLLQIFLMTVVGSV